MRIVIAAVALVGLVGCDSDTLKTQEALQKECWDRCELLPSGAHLCVRASYRSGYKSAIAIREATILDEPAHCVTKTQK